MFDSKYISANAAFCLFICALLVGCGGHPHSEFLQKPVVSSSETVGLSKNYELFMEYNYPLIQNNYINEYLNGLIDSLSEGFSKSGLSFKVLVLDAPAVNAIAMPSGKIYMTKLLLKSLKNEAELVSIIGHEIGHIIAGHTEESLRKSYEIQQSLQRLSEVVEDNKVKNITALFGYAILKGFNREQELEADKISYVLLEKNQYPVNALKSSLQNIYAAAQQFELADIGSNIESVPDVFSSHPSIDIRLNKLSELIEKSGKSVQIENNSQYRFNKFISMLD